MLILCSLDKEQIRRWEGGLGVYADRYTVCHSLDELGSASASVSDSLVLFDLHLLAGNAQRLADFITVHSHLKFFVFSERHEPEEGQVLVASGARGYANRYMHPEVLGSAVRLVLAGEVWLGADLVLHLIKLNAAAVPQNPRSDAVHTVTGLDTMTARELDIARLIVSGNSNKLIARDLGITERTVKAHLSSIFKKTQTRDRLQLAILLKDAI